MKNWYQFIRVRAISPTGLMVKGYEWSLFKEETQSCRNYRGTYLGFMCGKNFLTVRAIQKWCELPCEAVGFLSLDRYLSESWPICQVNWQRAFLFKDSVILRESGGQQNTATWFWTGWHKQVLWSSVKERVVAKWLYSRDGSNVWGWKEREEEGVFFFPFYVSVGCSFYL